MKERSYKVYKNLIVRLEDKEKRGFKLTKVEEIQLKSARRSVLRYESGRGAL